MARDLLGYVLKQVRRTRFTRAQIRDMVRDEEEARTLEDYSPYRCPSYYYDPGNVSTRKSSKPYSSVRKRSS